jgi:hypothetical protein
MFTEKAAVLIMSAENCIKNDKSMFEKLKDKKVKEEVLIDWLNIRIAECEKILKQLAGK